MDYFAPILGEILVENGIMKIFQGPGNSKHFFKIRPLILIDLKLRTLLISGIIYKLES